MRYRKVLVIAAVAAALVAGGWFLAARASVSALDDPSRVETYLATRAKHWLVRRAARTVPLPPADEMASVMIGQSLFMMCCASSLAQSRLQAAVALPRRDFSGSSRSRRPVWPRSAQSPPSPSEYERAVCHHRARESRR